VLPLLSGHQGGANELARKLAGLIGAQLVVTTANPYLKPVYTVGMGCERDCAHSEMQALLDTCLAQAGLSLEQVSSINSIDLKVDEPGLLELGKSIGKPFQVFDKHQLSEEESLLSTRSDYVYQTVGVYGVAESAALYAARQITANPAELVLEKQKSKRATCAIARSYPSPGKES
jgi:cobalt-precorrin 5A hydrolase